MALSSDIEAKLSEAEVPREMKLPSMEPVPAASGAPGLPGLLSRPAFALKISAATLLLGAVAALLTPLAFPPRVSRLPPPLPPRAPARRPPRRPASPLPRWMLAKPVPLAASARPPAIHGPKARPLSPGSSRPQPVTGPKPAPGGRQLATRSGPIRIHEPEGTACTVAASGVTLGGKRVPPEWAREVRRLFVPPGSGDPAPASERPALRLLEPNPSDAAVLDPPVVFRWSAVPGVKRYQLSLEALTDPVEQTWHPVQDLFMLDVTGTRFEVPADVKWAPGAVYRWRVQTEDGSAVAAGRFRVLSAAQRERLLAARRTAGESHVLRAAIYRSFGLYDAALDELRALHSAQPQQPALRQALLDVEADMRRQRASAAAE